MSFEILVSLRTAASAEAPSSPISFHPILQSMGKVGGGEKIGVSMGADTKANVSGGGTLEFGDLCLVEDGSNRSGTLLSDVVAGETAK